MSRVSSSAEMSGVISIRTPWQWICIVSKKLHETLDTQTGSLDKSDGTDI